MKVVYSATDERVDKSRCWIYPNYKVYVFVTDVLKTENEFMCVFLHFSAACIYAHISYIIK